MKHTPGTWHVGRNANERLCVWHGANRIATIEHFPHSGNEANARLIAAAPEMLKALRWTRQTIHQAYHEGDVEQCGKNTCMHLTEVINKAEGK